MKIDKNILKTIPKTDLHLHLDGSLRLETLIDLANKQKVDLPSFSQEGLREKVFKDRYSSLEEYLTGFGLTCSVLNDPEALERVAYELALDNQKEGVYYIEVRYAPQLHVTSGKIEMEDVLVAVNKGLDRAKKEFNSQPEVLSGKIPYFDYGIIACAMRFFLPVFSNYYSQLYSAMKFCPQGEVIKTGAMELARAVVQIRDNTGIPIVGFDLAGAEAGYPASRFIEAYDYVHKNFMSKTVHAGEAYGAESIFQALTQLHADRIGHGYFLFDESKVIDPSIKDKKKYVENIASFIADRRTTVEVCLTSNLQTLPELENIKNHTFKKMLDHKISTTICTDNRLVSNTTVTKEFELAVDNFDLDMKDLRNIVLYGFKRSFYPGNYNEKRKYVRSIMNYFEKITDTSA